MASRERSSIFARSSVPTALAVAAAVLAAIPLVISRLDGDADLDPYFAALVAAALAVGIAMRSAMDNPAAWLTARLVVVAWWGVALWAAFLLVYFETACGCSSPDPGSLPAPRVPTAVSTPSHLAAAYGGGILVALAAFGPMAPRSKAASEA